MKNILIKLNKQEIKDIKDGLKSRRLNLKDIEDVYSKAKREIKIIDKILKEL